MRKLIHGLGESFFGWLTVDLRCVIEQCASRLRVLFDEYDVIAHPRCIERRAEAGTTRSDNQHVAMSVYMLVP